MNSRHLPPGAFAQELLAGPVAPYLAEPEQARVRRIAREAAEAFRRMARVRKGVAVFGSAQKRPVSRWGALAREVSRSLAEAGFTILTGGGPGLMAAASDGAHRGGGVSVGLTIHLPSAEPPNRHLTLEVPFHYFFLRKLAFVKYSCAFILLPGGYGTLDELFEALNLRRTHRLDPFPVILVGSEYWNGLLDWLRSTGVPGGTLSEADLRLLVITDDPKEVTRLVSDCHATLCRRLGILE